MIGELAIFGIVLIVSYGIWVRYRTLSLRNRMGLAGPPTNFFLGNSHQVGVYIRKHGPRMAEFLRTWTDQYGKVFGFYFGPKYWVMVSDLDMVKDILIKQFNYFTDRMEMILLRKALNTSIINLKGQEWKQVRSSITPTFSGAKMKQMSTVMGGKLDTFMKNMEIKADSGGTFDIYYTFKALTLDVIGKCAFAMDVDCQNDPNDPFLLNGIKFFREQPSPENSTLIKFAVLFPELASFWCFLSNALAIAEAENWMFGNLEKIIAHRVTDKTFKDSVDIMQLLLDQASGESNQKETSDEKVTGLSMEQVASNCFVFLLAGYETTSTALGFTGWLLAKHPEVQAKMQEEIDRNVTNENDINYDLVHKLSYLDAVFHESLRMFPPVVMFIARRCVQDCIVGGIHFEPGTQVLIPVYTIHRDPEIWPDPDTFDPERFFNNKEYHPMAWMPFGAGPRNCVGLRFAEMEYKLTLTRLLYKFSLEMGPDYQDPLPITNHNALMSPDQVMVKVVHRK